ncbi:MAG: hypothetical protein ACYC7F_11325 [Gemmatimonadaceae bacterium]
MRKDLVLWREPDTNNWTPEGGNGARALAVMEWKSLNNVGVTESHPKKRRQHQGDIEWLCRMTARSPMVTGYAVLVDLVSKPTIVTHVVVRNGRVVPT